jgi:hypothetical protein
MMLLGILEVLLFFLRSKRLAAGLILRGSANVVGLTRY